MFNDINNHGNPIKNIILRHIFCQAMSKWPPGDVEYKFTGSPDPVSLVKPDDVADINGGCM